MSPVHRPMVREQHVDPPLEGSEMETDIAPDVLKGLGQIIRPGGLLSPNGLRWETGQRTRGSSQRQAQARLRRPQEPAVGPRLPSCSLLLLGHRRVTGEARCQVMGWEGRPLAGLGPAWGCPALPCQALTRQPSTTPLSGRQTISPFSPRAAWLAFPAPVSP